MNRIFIVALLVAAAVVTSALPVPAQTMSTVNKGTPLNVNSLPITGFAAFATPTLALSNTAQRMTPVPAGTVAVTIIASGAVNFGSSSVVPGSGASGVVGYRHLADGAELTIPIYPTTSQPDIWFCVTATGASNIGVRFVAHVQK